MRSWYRLETLVREWSESLQALRQAAGAEGRRKQQERRAGEHAIAPGPSGELGQSEGLRFRPGVARWYTQRMETSLNIDVSTLDTPHRRAREEVIGQQL